MDDIFHEIVVNCKALLDNSGEKHKDPTKKTEVKKSYPKKVFADQKEEVTLDNLISNMQYEISIWAASEYGIGPKTIVPIATNPFPPIWNMTKTKRTDKTIEISWKMPKPGVGNASASTFDISLYEVKEKSDRLGVQVQKNSLDVCMNTWNGPQQ